MRSLQKLQQNLFICASSVAQQAGIAALRQAEPDVERMKLVYDERRRYMIARLREMGYYRLLSFCIRCTRTCTRRYYSRGRFWYGRRRICTFLLCKLIGEYPRRARPHQSLSFSARLLISAVAASYWSSVTRTDTEGAI